MRATVRCPASRRQTLLPELAAAPISKITAKAPVACSKGNPNNNVSSEPGAKKSIIRPIAHGIDKLTAVETERKATPAVKSFHSGFASVRSFRTEEASGFASFPEEVEDVVGDAVADGSLIG